MNFTSHVDAVITAAVNLVNAVTPGEARGRAFEQPAGGDLRARVIEALHNANPGARAPTAAEAADLAVVAGRLRAVFDAVDHGAVDSAAASVNGLLAETGARPQLDRHDGEPWHMHFHASTDSLADGWAAGCATRRSTQRSKS